MVSLAIMLLAGFICLCGLGFVVLVINAGIEMFTSFPSSKAHCADALVPPDRASHTLQ